MRRYFARWRFRYLLVSWLGYWAALAVVKLTPAAVAIWVVSRPGVKGDVNAGITDGILKVSVAAAGSVTWVGSVSLVSLALWLAGPPILLWACWLFASSRTRGADDASAPAQLSGGDELPVGQPRRAKDEARMR